MSRYWLGRYPDYVKAMCNYLIVKRDRKQKSSQTKSRVKARNVSIYVNNYVRVELFSKVTQIPNYSRFIYVGIFQLPFVRVLTHLIVCYQFVYHFTHFMRFYTFLQRIDVYSFEFLWTLCIGFCRFPTWLILTGTFIVMQACR